MLIAEELFLLLQPGTVDGAEDPFTGTQHENRDRHRSWLALAGAALVELAELQRVAFTEARDDVEPNRLLVMDQTPTGHPALDGALGRLKDVEGSLPKDAIPAMAGHLPTELFEALREAGAVHQPEGESYYQLGEEADAATVRRLSALRDLVQTGTGDERSRLLHALLWGAELAGFVIGTDADQARHEPTDSWIADELAKALATTELTTGDLGAGPV